MEAYFYARFGEMVYGVYGLGLVCIVSRLKFVHQSTQQKILWLVPPILPPRVERCIKWWLTDRLTDRSPLRFCRAKTLSNVSIDRREKFENSFASGKKKETPESPPFFSTFFFMLFQILIYPIDIQLKLPDSVTLLRSHSHLCNRVIPIYITTDYGLRRL